MSDDPEVTVTLTFSRQVAERLAVLDDPAHAGDPLAEQVTAVLDILADHAQQGAYRSGSWERSWLMQAFGDEWLGRMEPDPDVPGFTGHQRPRLRETGESDD